jgi:parvulin-like peptidyl-prolyl isomerase
VDALPAPLPEALQHLQPGDQTGLVQTPFLSYIFKVAGRRGGEVVSLAKAQPEIEAELREQKFEMRYEVWMQGLRDEFQVVRYNPDISAVTGEL